MTVDLYLAAYAVAMTWVMVFSAGMLKSRAWTPAGMKIAFGNRDDVGEPSPLAARADRAAKNMLESLPLFLGLVAIAHLGGRTSDRVVWWVSIAGLAVIFSALL